MWSCSSSDSLGCEFIVGFLPSYIKVFPPSQVSKKDGQIK